MDFNTRYRLELVGITYNQIESGVYALILQQVGGTCRIPIIIGTAEAQSIECRLQNIITPRPLTHDLMVNIMRAYGIALREVEIRRLPNGVFAANLILSDDSREIVIDSRSSDAIALAVRFDVPIFTTGEILMSAGFENQQSSKLENKQNLSTLPNNGEKNILQQLSDKKLIEMLNEAVEQERYEEASKIKIEIERRNLKI